MGLLGGKLTDVISDIIGTLYGWLIKPFIELHTFAGLIFGRTVWGDEETDLAFGIFTLDELENIYQPGMNLFMVLAVTGIVIGIVFSGMRIASSGINPSNRTYVFEFMKDLAIVAIVLFNLSTLYTLIFGINYTIVELFDYSYAELIELKPSLDNSGGDILGGLLIGLMLLGLMIWANFYYMMRKLTLLLFMIMGPLMVALYLIPQTKSMTLGWLKEFIGTVFVQSIHAALYWVVSLIAISTTGLEGVILYLVFIPTAEAIRSLVGLGGGMSTNLSKAGAMFGMSALAGMYGSVKGALGDKSVAGALRGAYEGTKDRLGKGSGSKEEEGAKKSTLAANSGTNTGSTARAEKMLKSGEITSKMGKAVLGMAGSVAGSVTGPAGSIIGSTIGFTGGGVVGGLAGRVGHVGASGLNRVGKNALNSLKGIGTSARDGFKADSLADQKVAKEMADSETAKWASDNKESFMKDMMKKFPDAHDSALEGMWNKELETQRSQNLTKAMGTVGKIRENDGKYANVQSLADATANKLTNDWAKKNEEGFKTNWNKENPENQDWTEGERTQWHKKRDNAWEKKLDSKRNQYSKVANDTAENMSNGLPTDHAFINKKDYANSVANQVMDADKNEFTQKYKLKNPNASDQEIDVEFKKQNGQRGYLTQVNAAANNVKSAKLYNRNDVNTDYLASQLATLKTNDSKKTFIESFGSNDKEGELQWQKIEANEYKTNLKQVASHMPKQIPLDKAIHFQSGIANGVVGAATGVGTGLLTLSGVKQASSFIMNSKPGKIMSAGAIGFSQGVLESTDPTKIASSPQKQIFGNIAGGIKGASKEIVTSWKMPVENAEVKQQSFKNTIAYGTGVIGGVRGYQSGAKAGMKLNPYNRSVNQPIAEVSDINHMVQRIDDGRGNTQIPSGAIQLVTNGNQSYVQVRDKTGQTQIVSRYASGDSTLKKGQEVYQDLDIQNGALVSRSEPYRLDSGGAKIMTGRAINVNPNMILANRNTPKTPRVAHEVQALNQQVDSGQMTSEQVLQQTSNIRMVVTRERSYMVANDRTGKKYRVSPYHEGDARLNQEEVREIKCTVRNRRIIKDEVINENNTPTEYYSSLSPEELLPPRTNKRLARRNEFEGMRHKSLGGTN